MAKENMGARKKLPLLVLATQTSTDQPSAGRRVDTGNVVNGFEDVR